MLAMVRMVSKDSYGEFGTLTSFVGLITVFSAANFVAHIIQVGDDSVVHYQDHFTACFVLQGGACLVTNLLAFALSFFNDYAQLSPYLHVMSIGFLLDCPAQFRTKMLERNFQWRRIRTLQAIGIIAGSLLGLLMAWKGFGTYSLVVPGMLVTLPFIWDLFVSEKWRPTWQWSRQSYQPAISFGLSRIASNSCNAIRSNIPTVVMPSMWTFAAIGVFGRSTNLAQLICSKISGSLVSAIYPVLTRLEAHGHDPAKINGLLLRVIVWTGVPLATVLAAQPRPLITMAYGSQWSDVIAIMPWATAWALAVAVGSASYSIMLSRNLTRQCLQGDIGILLATIPLVWLILPKGTGPYLMALALITWIQVVWFLYSLVRVRALTTVGIVAAFGPPLVASSMGFAAASSLDPVISLHVHWVLAFSVWCTVFSLAFCCTIRLAFPQLLREQIGLLPKSLKLERWLSYRVTS